MLDTETTGLNTKYDRIVELAIIELKNGKTTNQVYHSHFNPHPNKVSKSAFAIHGLSNEYLSSQPKFQEEAQRILRFVKQGKLIAHNAKFDLEIVNHELVLIGLAAIEQPRWYDTLKLARLLYPSGSNSLRALCKRFKIKVDTTKHDALTDCEMLAKVYAMLLTEKARREIDNSWFNNKLWIS
ncbi:MAG: exonuclease domain-containing protein [Candidatus Hodgkinia cicadicola]|nr:MAG: exonuclease domain-containing protein [Candidatus Hodgkinia cicadicola]